jgi:integrase/recombinase XerD
MKTYLKLEEMKLLELSATNPRYRPLIRLLSHLGCRISEVPVISVEDINFQDCVVTTQHPKTRLRLDCPQCRLKVERAVTKSKEYRRIRALPLDSDTLELVSDYINLGGPVLRKGKRLLFSISRNQAWRVVRDCAQRAGLEELVNPETGKTRSVSPHSLRDAFAVHAIKMDESGEGLRLLQEHLGHASFNTTARYRKVAGDEHRRWYDQLWGSGTQYKQ